MYEKMRHGRTRDELVVNTSLSSINCLDETISRRGPS